jgi:CMP-N-acetylneuraminic acid synthetase
MKNVVIIPARGGSKRLEHKNVLLLDGIPLLAHSILYAKANAAWVDAIYVSTDDDKIAEIARQYGAEVIIRPAALSGDHEPTVTALKHVVEQIGDIDNVFLLQPTNPLRPENLLAEAWSIYSEKQCGSLFTVTRNYQKFGRINGDKFVPYNYAPGQRSQDLEPLYFENGLLYIVSAKNIISEQIITADAFPLVVDHRFAEVDIDTLEDFEYAAFLINSNLNRNNEK